MIPITLAALGYFLLGAVLAGLLCPSFEDDYEGQFGALWRGGCILLWPLIVPITGCFLIAGGLHAWREWAVEAARVRRKQQEEEAALDARRRLAERRRALEELEASIARLSGGAREGVHPGQNVTTLQQRRHH